MWRRLQVPHIQAFALPAESKIFPLAETEGKHKPLSEQKSSSGDIWNVKLKLYISTIFFIKNPNFLTSICITKSVDDDGNKMVYNY